MNVQNKSEHDVKISFLNYILTNNYNYVGLFFGLFANTFTAN